MDHAIDLARCPVREGFRLRGLAMTRIETFTDAAFAFAVTLLVISIDAIPTNYAELIAATRGVPAFLLSFLALFLFWLAHWTWSRRYGLDDAVTILLSFTIVFITLCYVYPLRYLAALFVTFFSGGYLDAGARLDSAQQLYQIFVVYGVGFVAMCGAVVALYAWAWKQRDALQLNALERFVTAAEIRGWLIMLSVGVLSILVALFTPPRAIALPGFVYTALAVVMPIYGVMTGRRQKRMAARPTVPHRER